VKTIVTLLLWGGLAATLGAQQLQLNFEYLAAKASAAVDVSLNGATLQFAAGFLNGKDPQEAQVKKLLTGITGIYVKSYEFKTDGVWTQADLERVRNQLRAPQWSRIIGVKSTEDGETAEVYVRSENQKMTGLAILVAEPKELTVVNIVGSVDLNSLSELGGHFGVPKLEVTPGQKSK